MQVIANPGTYVVRPSVGTNRACGVYIAGLHDETITIDVSHVDVSCEYGGLVAVSLILFPSSTRIFRTFRIVLRWVGNER